MSYAYEGQPHDEPGPRPPDHFTQDFRHTPVSARVPEKIGRGVFATAIMILQTQDDFILDFLSAMVQPHQVVARVVLTAPTFAQFLAALRANVAKYEQQFGPLTAHRPTVPPPAEPPGPDEAAPAPKDVPSSLPPPTGTPPTIEELYNQLKLPDEMLGGVFANVVMIRHTAEEFCFDFIASFYPRSVVTARVYLAAGRISPFVEALAGSWQKYQQRARGGPPPQNPPGFV